MKTAFLAAWSVTRTHRFNGRQNSQAYRANESVDINTVINNGEEIINVGYIADGEWLRYTVDVTYISEIESTKGASVEQ